MKWFTRVFSVLLCLCLVLGAVPTALGEDAAFERYEWPDDKLRSAVLISITLKDGIIEALNADVDDEKFLRTQVTYLTLILCAYTELPDLSAFEALETLVVDGNPLTQLDALDGNTTITTLSIANTPMTRLPHLPNLTGLDATECDIATHTSFDELPPLTSIKLGSSKRPLMPEEQALMEKNATQLKALSITASTVGDISFLSSCTQVEDLTLSFSEPSQPIPEEALRAISAMPLTSLTLQNTDISDLSFLKDKNTMVDLNLASNRIDDISTLSGMRALESLKLQNNAIQDLSPLQGAQFVRTLDVANNQISDLSPLSGMGSLSNLNLNDNQVSDLTPLASAGRLSTLDADRNQITDLSPLSKNERLMTLSLNENSITNVKPLSKLKNLYNLQLSCNQIVDPSALAKLSISTLELYDNPLNEKKLAAFKDNAPYTGTRDEYERLTQPFQSDCEALMDVLTGDSGTPTYRDVRNRISLTLTDAGLTEWPDLSAFSDLVMLHIQGNTFTSFPGELTGLTSLSIGDCARPLTEAELAFIAQNEGIEQLSLSASDFTGLDTLASLKNLTTLSLVGSEGVPVDLSPTSKLKKLTTCELAGCAISADTLKPVQKKLNRLALSDCTLAQDALQAVGKCTKLTSVALARNKITDVTALAKLKKLKELDLAGNNITDVSPIYKLKNLTTLTLKENPIAAPSEVLETFPFAALN